MYGDYSKFPELKGILTAPGPQGGAENKPAVAAAPAKVTEPEVPVLSGMVTAGQLERAAGKVGGGKVVRLAKGARVDAFGRRIWWGKGG